MAKITARKANIEPSTTRVVGQQQHGSNAEAGTPKDYHKRMLTIPLLDHLISDTYFDPNNDAVMSSLLCLLLALLVSREENLCKPLFSTMQMTYHHPSFLMWNISVGGASG